jgi:hypothetical protein
MTYYKLRRMNGTESAQMLFGDIILMRASTKRDFDNKLLIGVAPAKYSDITPMQQSRIRCMLTTGWYLYPENLIKVTIE